MIHISLSLSRSIIQQSELRRSKPGHDKRFTERLLTYWFHCGYCQSSISLFCLVMCDLIHSPFFFINSIKHYVFPFIRDRCAMSSWSIQDDAHYTWHSWMMSVVWVDDGSLLKVTARLSDSEGINYTAFNTYHKVQSYHTMTTWAFPTPALSTYLCLKVLNLGR